MNKIGFYISTLLLALLIFSSTIFVVDQRQFGVVYSLGQIKKVITEPGLNFKLPPPLQNVNFIDKRLLTLDNVDSEPMLTAEKQGYWPPLGVTGNHFAAEALGGQMTTEAVRRDGFGTNLTWRVPLPVVELPN